VPKASELLRLGCMQARFTHPTFALTFHMEQESAYVIVVFFVRISEL